METKQNIRKRIFRLRSQVTDAQIHNDSLAILNRLTDTDAYKCARQVFTYVDFKHEVETRDLIRGCIADGKEVAVPRVRGKDMDFYHLTDFGQLEPGYFGIPEPMRGEIVTWEDALMIVPGVAFDPACHRVGYGQGFYDRYLSRHPDHPAIALAFSFQIVEAAPWEATDILPDMVITEKEIYRK
ncbi:MAG TPA: 5-formyltetrahydrofolate cyclo-ligase [Lachnospiraceae bacterium]|nr:5-formyltetrahydrofolate cyclo-ligase [Lachnospiraceae bacterium]